jgi:hypothetical protein
MIIRTLAPQKGYVAERAPVRDSWFLTEERTGKLAIRDNGASAWGSEKAIRFLKGLPDR